MGMDDAFLRKARHPRIMTALIHVGAVRTRGGERWRDGETERQTERERQRDRQTDRQRQRQTDRHTDRERDRDTDRDKGQQRERQREIQRDRQRDRQRYTRTRERHLKQTDGARSYRAGRNGILDIEVEAEVDHVEDSMPAQSGGQALVQTSQTQASRVDDVSCLGKGGGLLHRERSQDLPISTSYTGIGRA